MNKVSGCIDVVLYVFICATTGYLIATAFMDSIVLGIIISIIGIILINKTPKPSFTKAESSCSTSSSSTTNSLVTNTTKNIDRDYFDQISKVVDDLMTVYDSAISSQEFRDAASDGFELHNGNQTIEDSTSKIQYLFWLDMAHCGRGLHLPYDRLDKTSYALFYFMERTMGGEKLSYENHRNLFRYSNHVMAESALKECYFSWHDAEDSNFFMVAHVLGKIDELQKQKYLVLLYRFASIMAKADNTVTEDEAKFLNSIMQLQSDGNNIAVAGDPDMPETEYYKAPLNGDLGSRKALDALIGLESVKQDVTALTNFIRIQNARSQKGLKASLSPTTASSRATPEPAKPPWLGFSPTSTRNSVWFRKVIWWKPIVLGLSENMSGRRPSKPTRLLTMRWAASFSSTRPTRCSVAARKTMGKRPSPRCSSVWRMTANGWW